MTAGESLTLQGEGGIWGSAHSSSVSLSLPVAAKAVQRFEAGGDGSPGRGAPRQRLLLLEVTDKKVSAWVRGLGRGGVL